MPEPSTTKQELTLDRQVGGLDSTTLPTLMSDGAWRQHHNMRSFNGQVVQVPRKVEVGQLESCHPHEVLDIVNLPGSDGYGHVLGITREHVWQLRSPVSSSVKLWDQTGPLAFRYDASYQRWARTVYNGQVFLTNELNPIAVSDGTTARYLVGNTPRARYLTHFFDHLVVGWVGMDGVVMQGRMLWSHLYAPSQWSPARSNEADHWDFDEDDFGQSLVRGVTGIDRLGDTLFVVTPCSIRPVSYVGLPKVFQVGPNISGTVGNGLKYGLVKADRSLYFFDVNESMFFAFDGQGIKPVGGPIQGFLAENVTTNPELQQRTWGYHHPEYNEVVWVFCSNVSSGAFDLALAYNYRTGVWHSRSVENVQSFGGRMRRAGTVGELAGTAGGLSGLAGDLGHGALASRYFGSADGKLLREEEAGDALTTLITQARPVLESRDFHYGSMQSFKEVDTITPHTSYEEAKGVEVEVSTRDYVDDAVIYRTPPRLWTPTAPYKRITDLHVSGRLFRLRIQPLTTGAPTVTETNCVIPVPVPHGVLYTRLGDPAAKPEFGATLAGVVAGYSLDAWRATAPADLLPYVYGAPSTADPYALPQSAAMLADAEAYGLGYLASLGYDNITHAGWEYFSTPTVAWLYTHWPSWGSIPINFSQGWVITTQGFHSADNPKWPQNPAALIQTHASVVAGTVGIAYTAKLRVRINSALMKYVGGTNNGAYFQTGGTADDSAHPTVKLTVSNPAGTFYLNRGTVSTSYAKAVDYEVDIPVVGGATITLELDRRFGALITTDEYGRVNKLAGFSPLEAVWASVDYSLRLPSGTARTIAVSKSGGVRGWKWSGMTQNILITGAEK